MVVIGKNRLDAEPSGVTIQEIIDQISNQTIKDRLNQLYVQQRNSIRVLERRIQFNLQELANDFAGDLVNVHIVNEKIVSLVILISGLDKARSLPEWRSLEDNQIARLEDYGNTVEVAQITGTRVPGYGIPVGPANLLGALAEGQIGRVPPGFRPERSPILPPLPELDTLQNEIGVPIPRTTGRRHVQRLAQMGGVGGVLRPLASEEIGGGVGIRVNREGAERDPSLQTEITRLVTLAQQNSDKMALELLQQAQERLRNPANDTEEVRKSVESIRMGLEDAEIRTYQDALRKLDTWESVLNSGRSIPHEANTIFFTSLVNQLSNKLGYQFRFGSADFINVIGPDGASDIEARLKSDGLVRDWFRKAILMNSSGWNGFVRANGRSLGSATVSQYHNYFLGKIPVQSRTNIDRDYITSYTNGAYDSQIAPSYPVVPGGYRIGQLGQTSQMINGLMLAKPYRNSLLNLSPRMAGYAGLIYDVAKYAFAIKTGVSVVKAMWATVFGDGAAQKKAWEGAGKNFLIAAGLWYGGPILKDIAGDLVSSARDPEYMANMRGKKVQVKDGAEMRELSGLSTGFDRIWADVGGGVIAPGEGSFLSTAERFLQRYKVPGDLFKSLWDDFMMGEGTVGLGMNFLQSKLPDLRAALNHRYNGSGGIREYLKQFGVAGDKIYIKYFTDDLTAKRTMNFLRSIADYRTTESYPGAADAIGDRDQSIAYLFYDRPEDEPARNWNLDPSARAFRGSVSELAENITILGISAGTGLTKMVTYVVDGVQYSVQVAGDILTDPSNRAILNKVLAAALAIGGGAGAIKLLTVVMPGTGVMGGIRAALIIGTLVAGGKFVIDALTGNAIHFNTADEIYDFLTTNRAIPQTVKDYLTTTLPATMTKEDKLKALVTGGGPIGSLPGKFGDAVKDWYARLTGGGSGGAGGTTTTTVGTTSSIPPAPAAVVVPPAPAAVVVPPAPAAVVVPPAPAAVVVPPPSPF